MDLVLPWASHWQRVCYRGGEQNVLLCFMGCEAPQNPCAGKEEKHKFPPTILHIFMFLDTVSYDPCERFLVLLRRTEKSVFFYSAYNFIRKLRWSSPDPQLAGVISYPTARLGLVYLNLWKLNDAIFGRYLRFYFFADFFHSYLVFLVRFYLYFSIFFCSKIQSALPVNKNPYSFHITILKWHFVFT